MFLYPLELCDAKFFSDLIEGGVDFLGLFHLLDGHNGEAGPVPHAFTDGGPQAVPLQDLLALVPVDDRIEARKTTAPHHVFYASFFYSKPLDDVVCEEVERVVPRGVVAGADQETARPRFDEEVDGLGFGDVRVEPAEDNVRVNVLVQVLNQVAKNGPLFSGTVSGHPQPAAAQLVVNEKNVAFLEAAELKVVQNYFFRVFLKIKSLKKKKN